MCKSLLFDNPSKMIILSVTSRIEFTRNLLNVAFAMAVFLPVQFAAAAELLMFDDEYCSWCKKWDNEIGVIYSLTPESCQAPLRKIDINDSIPESITVIENIVYTPTFILVHKEIEVGRITGYPGEDFFWPMLNGLIDDNIPKEVRKTNSSQCRNS